MIPGLKKIDNPTLEILNDQSLLDAMRIDGGLRLHLHLHLHLHHELTGWQSWVEAWMPEAGKELVFYKLEGIEGATIIRARTRSKEEWPSMVSSSVHLAVDIGDEKVAALGFMAMDGKPLELHLAVWNDEFLAQPAAMVPQIM